MGFSRHCLSVCVLGLLVVYVSTVRPDGDTSLNLAALLRRLSSGILVGGQPVVIDRPEVLTGNSHDKDEESNEIPLPQPQPTQTPEEDEESNEIHLLQPQPTQATNTPDHHDNPRPPLGPKVLTRYGIIQGLTVEKANIFYGIPYADPPVAGYRWKAPRTVSPWKGEYDATFPRSACMQGCIGPVSVECPAKVRTEL